MHKRAAISDALALVGLFLFAALYSYGRWVCTYQSAEDLVLVMNSAVDPSLYYPGSNRGGNLVGILAGGVSDVLANHQFQNILRLFFAVAWPYVALRMLAPFGHAVLATLIYNVVCLAQFGTVVHLIYHSSHPYSASLFFMMASFAGLLAAANSKGPPRWAFFALSVVAANLAAFIAPTTLIVTIAALCAFLVITLVPAGADTAWRRSCVLTGAALGVAFSAFAVAVVQTTVYARAFPGETRSFSSASYTNLHLDINGVWSAAQGVITYMGGWLVAAEVLFVLVAVPVLLLLGRRKPEAEKVVTTTSWLLVYAFLLGGFGYTLISSQLEHIWANAYNVRYFMYVPMFAVLGVSLAAAVGLLALKDRLVAKLSLFPALSAQAPESQPRGRLVRGVGPALSGLVVLAAAVLLVSTGASAFGPPQRQCLFGHGTTPPSAIGEAARAKDYYAVLGSYWDIWAIAFHAWGAASAADPDVAPTDLVLPTGYRSETFQSLYRPRWEKQMASNGRLEMLCVGEGKESEYGFPIDCERLVQWNRDWGIFPPFGDIRRISDPDGLASAVIVIEPPPLPGDGMIYPSAGGTRQLLGFGWETAPNEIAAWTVGEAASTGFVLDCAPGAAVVVTVTAAQWIGAFAPEGGPLNVTVAWNGERFAEKAIDGSELAWSAPVDPDLVRCGSANTLTLGIENPRSPHDYDPSNPDRRPLGLAVSSITVDVARP